MQQNPNGTARARYNQKGRMASLQKEKDSKRKRAYEPDDSNVDMIDPEERKRKKLEAAALTQQAQAVAEPKMSSKKKKRLDAYVKRKLKKDDRVKLIQSLAQTQTQDLNLRSSSALGSKQFKTQAEKLSHASAVESSRRDRAGKIVKRIKGRGHLSDDSGSDEEDSEDGAMDLERELLPVAEVATPAEALKRSTTTLASKPRPEFNASGSLGIVEVVALPAASTSAAPKPPPASVPAVVGSGLKAGAVVQVVKRKPKEKGRMRAMFGKDKGKGKQVEESEESEFDSSDSAMDSSSEEEKGDDDEEEWGGIPDDVIGGRAPAVEESAEGSASASDSEDDEDEEDEADTPERPQRTKGSFQAWAEAQVATASGSTAPLISNGEPSSTDPSSYKPLLPSGSGVPAASLPDGMLGPLGSALPASELPSLPPQRTTHVPILRTPEMQAQREELPIVKEEDRIMTAIRGNSVVVICGETGSGKTTQVGQFLWEAGFGDASSDNPGMVAITQPRRVAALSTSQRVRAELCLPASSSLVAHRIRYSSTTSPDSKLVFMTDGVLLRELAVDFLLKKYSVVVVDEAHERGVNTDVLIGVLSRVARLREEMWKDGKEGMKPLRLIIMSATLRVSDFAENPTLFPSPPPVLHVTARQHPVTVHFSRKTHADYLTQAYKKVARIHARLPAGGILVFCTGQNEIVSLVKKLEGKYGKKAIEARKKRAQEMKEREEKRKQGREDWKKARDEAREQAEDVADASHGHIEMGDDFETEDMDLGANDDKDLAADVDDGLYDEDDVDGLESDEEDEKFGGMDLEDDTDEPMLILPLYSLLSTERQMKVFQEPPAGTRLVVVATNVAETSITIPNIKYVVDTGRAKERQFDINSGIQSFEVSWISKASAAQRSGRAGRTGPGHCYRLYSSAVFENYFDQHTKPEILRMPIEGIILQMKSMNIDAVANFPFPTPPDRDALRRAEKTLVHLGALEASSSAAGVGGKITELGRSMSLFPLSPRYSKMIVAGQQHGCLPYVIAVVCALSVGDPFIREANLGDDDDVGGGADLEEEKALSAAEIRHIRDPEIRRREELKVARKSFFSVQSRYAALGKGASDVFKILSVVGAYEYEGGKDSFCEANFVRTKAMQEIHKLRAQISRIVQATYPGIDAGFVPKLQPPSEVQLKVLRQLLTSAFIDQVAIRKDIADKHSSISYSKVASTRGVPYRAFGIDEDLFIHPSSGLFHQTPPEFLVFTELHRTHKIWLKTLTKINPAWLPTLGRPLCTFSKPIETPTTALAQQGGASKSTSKDTRQTFVVPRFGSGVGIELKPVMVEQKLVNGRWVFV